MPKPCSLDLRIRLLDAVIAGASRREAADCFDVSAIAPQQIDLFAGEPRTKIGGMPAWSGLPTETQAALTNLMTRLILEHADQSRIGSMTEASHDL